ncbi:RraA family protein [Rhodovulum sp. YEN HP10]|uniref:RraA family protein n=1 Tax=Rhodovulum sp. HP10 TaxID=3387397 RepID=UPI0039E09E94
MSFDCSVAPVNHPLSAEFAAGFSDIPAPVANDCYGRRNIMDAGIKPIARGMHLCGRAVTVVMPPDDNLMLHAALHAAEPGDILVASTSNDRQSGVWGELMTRAAMARGLGGLVLDGMCRDSDWIAKSGFQLFARGTCARGSRKLGPGHVNIPVAVGNVVVHHGDIIIGDDDGVMVVPAADAAALLPLCRDKLAKEAARIEAIAAGAPKPGWLMPALEKWNVA